MMASEGQLVCLQHTHFLDVWEEGQVEVVVSSWEEVQGEGQMVALALKEPSFQDEELHRAYLGEAEVGENVISQGVIYLAVY